MFLDPSIEFLSSYLICVYIIDLNTLRFSFFILQTKPFVIFSVLFLVCTAVLPNGTNVLAKKSNAPLTVLDACVP